jgi:hypothetical protein
MADASAPGTTIGVLMLCVLLGLRWAVGRWERAKTQWWEDWARVGEGLGRDLEVNNSFFDPPLHCSMGVHIKFTLPYNVGNT